LQDVGVGGILILNNILKK